jgi:hypothetical protein
VLLTDPPAVLASPPAARSAAIRHEGQIVIVEQNPELDALVAELDARRCTTCSIWATVLIVYEAQDLELETAKAELVEHVRRCHGD